jgi:uncharacterized membrane protein
MQLHQGASLTGVTAGGTFWGFLFGLLFLVPLDGMAVGADIRRMQAARTSLGLLGDGTRMMVVGEGDPDTHTE